jgi:hypothetical protein
MRRRPTSQATKLALMATAIIAAAAACSSPGNTHGRHGAPASPTGAQTSTSSRPLARQEFVSKRYGFRVTLSKDWEETDARLSWDGKNLQGIDSPAFANFTDPVGGRTLVAGAARVAKATGLTEWRAAMVRAAPSVCSDSLIDRRTTLGGEPALAWTAKCSDGFDVNKLAALHGGRGYMVFLPSNASNADVADKRVFESIRRSFRFTS